MISLLDWYSCKCMCEDNNVFHTKKVIVFSIECLLVTVHFNYHLHVRLKLLVIFCSTSLFSGSDQWWNKVPQGLFRFAHCGGMSLVVWHYIIPKTHVSVFHNVLTQLKYPAKKNWKQRENKQRKTKMKETLKVNSICE